MDFDRGTSDKSPGGTFKCFQKTQRKKRTFRAFQHPLFFLYNVSGRILRNSSTRVVSEKARVRYAKYCIGDTIYQVITATYQYILNTYYIYVVLSTSILYNIIVKLYPLQDDCIGIYCLDGTYPLLTTFIPLYPTCILSGYPYIFIYYMTSLTT